MFRSQFFFVFHVENHIVYKSVVCFVWVETSELSSRLLSALSIWVGMERALVRLTRSPVRMWSHLRCAHVRVGRGAGGVAGRDRPCCVPLAPPLGAVRGGGRGIDPGGDEGGKLVSCRESPRLASDWLREVQHYFCSGLHFQCCRGNFTRQCVNQFIHLTLHPNMAPNKWDDDFSLIVNRFTNQILTRRIL